MRFKLGSAWFCDTECMDSVEDLVTELKALTPDRLDRVARIVRELHGGSSQAAAGDRSSVRPAAVPPQVLEQAVRNGWPSALFTDVIGRIPEDFDRAVQPPHEVRPAL